MTRHVCAEEHSVKVVPAGRLFPITFADPREIRSAISFAGGSQINAILGSYLSLISISPADKYWDFHLGLEGRALFTMRQEGSKFPLETVDGTLGIYTELAQGRWRAQLRYTHVSAHLADGSTLIAFPYSREFVSLRGAYVASEALNFYFGIHKIVNTVPKVHGLALQLGGSYFLPLGGQLSPFIAGDLRWQEESVVNPSFALQLGLALHETGDLRRTFRMFYSYYTGMDVRGQYYLRPQTIHSFAVEIPL